MFHLEQLLTLLFKCPVVLDTGRSVMELVMFITSEPYPKSILFRQLFVIFRFSENVMEIDIGCPSGNEGISLRFRNITL